VKKLVAPHIAIDIGSSSIKGAIVDVSLNTICHTVSCPFPLPLTGLPAGFVEIEPSAVVAAVKGVVESLLEHSTCIRHVWISGQMGGVLLCDTNGRALTNYLSWRDQRSLESIAGEFSLVEEIRRKWTAEVFSGLGNELQVGSTSTLLYWLRRHGKLGPEAIPCSVSDYVLANLAGKTPTMHATYAIGLLDLSQICWHWDALERIELDKVSWPQLIKDEEVVATWRIGNRNLEVHGAFGDHQTALLGAGLGHGELSINVSTGSQVSHRTREFVPGPYQSRIFFGNEWLNTVTHLPAGRALNALMDPLKELSSAEEVELKRPWETIAQKMAEVDHTDLKVNLNFFTTPLGSAGELKNITTENFTIGHLFVAACETMAENYQQIAHGIAPVGSYRSLVLSGGLPQALPKLRELIRKRFNVPIRDSQSEETLLGLLSLARQFTSAGEK